MLRPPFSLAKTRAAVRAHRVIDPVKGDRVDAGRQLTL